MSRNHVPGTRSAGWRRLRASALVPAVVLASGLLLTGLAVRGSQASLDAVAQSQFNREADALEAEIRRRLARTLAGLNGLRATFAASGNLDTAALRRYLAHGDLATEFPGIRGFGVIERVPRDALAAFEARQRASGAPDFRVRTAPGHADMLVVRSIEPLARNANALGFDSGTNAIAREALEHAIDTGIATLTPALTLQQDEAKGLGWVLYLPVYQGEPRSQDQRRAALQAVVFAPIVARELLSGAAALAGARADFRVYDDESTHRHLVVDEARASQASRVSWRSSLIGQRVLALEILGRDSERGADRAVPWVIGAGGAALSVALAFLAWVLLAARTRALASADAAKRDVSRLAAIVEHTSSAVFTTDADGRLTWINKSFEALTGAQRADLLGKSALDILRSAEGIDAKKRRAILRGLRHGLSQRFDVAGTSAMGEQFWVKVAMEPESGPDGAISGFSGIALDITSRKLAEQQLAAREHLLRTITDNLPARISYWSVDGQCLFANRRFAEVYGLRLQEVTADARQRMEAKGFSAGTPQVRAVLRGMPQQFEQEIVEADGRSSVWQVHYLPDEQGHRVRGFFVLANEVTELRKARDLALEGSRAKTRFLSNMSHEIRTPMNAVLGMLTLIRGTRLSERQEDYVAKAESAARSLLALLNDVLDFSKIEAGKLQLDCHPFALDSVFADLSVILSANVGAKDLEVLYDLDPATPAALVGDDLRLRQVLINLGGNAVKFTTSGEVLLRTRVVARNDAQVTIEFSVIDSGIGISEDDQRRLFEDYVQAGGGIARQFGGTGLGLAISRRLLELMGSQLEVESRLGHGSRFHFRLAMPVADEAMPLPAAACGIQRVLIADDNEVARTTLAGLAQSLGWQADTAADGASAVQCVLRAQARGMPYGAVFMDWRMPGMDGWDASLNIRSATAGTRVPLIVMVTAQGRDTLSQRSPEEQSTLDAFLVKPVTANMLRDTVERALGGPKPASTPARTSQALEGIRVLVAEDNAVNQQIARELLESQGAEVVIADDGRQALDRLADDGAFDLVLMDMLMPVMDGLAATRLIRANPRLQHLPVIAMTANAATSDRADCLAAGMNDHIAKPVVLAEMVASILRAVHAARPVTELPSPMAADTPLPPMLDREGAVARLGGNAALYERLLPMFRANLHKAEQELRAALDRAARDDLGRLMHTLKGTAGSMGAIGLAAAAQRAETQLTAGSDAAHAVASVLSAIAATLHELAEPAGRDAAPAP